MENQILLGDCYLLLKETPSKSVDLILTDPPYQISRESNFSNHSNTKFNKISLDFGDWDKEEINIGLLFQEFYRVLKKGGTVIFFYDIWKSNDVLLNATKVGFSQPRVCQWVKTNPVPINSKRNYLSNAIEYFFTFVKGGKPTFKSYYDRGIYNFPICHGKERTSHPTQKPLSLINELVTKHSNEGDVILDCFAGSGTVGQSCKDLKRDFILMEKDEGYYNIIKTRLSQ
jgi:site-specific DNA-methyltransferase (adenine-specific)